MSGVQILTSIVMGLTAIGVLIGIGISIGESMADSRWRKDAVDHDVAEWRCDPITGETHLYWKDEPTNKEGYDGKQPT